MASLITKLASPEASGEADPGIVETYKARLQALGYSSGLSGKCIRTILHLIAWLSANGTGIETGLALDDLKMPALDEVHIIGKGRRERILPLWKETRRTLRDWLAVRPESADRHLFLNAMGTGMTRRGFAKRLALHAQTAACSAPSIAGKTVSPHLLRHACALHTLEATGDVRKVSLWLGHSSVQTTEMYLQADPTDKLDTLDKWRPPSLRKGRFNGVQDELLAMLAGT